MDLVSQRLRNQRLSRPSFRNAEDVVSWLGAVQAQDYTGAKWALGLRATVLTDADVERAFTEGRILRTHVLRPTWHFVVPADIRWMLTLTAPRVNAVSAYYYRKLELDAATFARSRTTLERALRGGRHLTRAELASALQRAGIPAEGQRLGSLMMRAELDGVICSGPRRGKQFTYAMLEERAPRARSLTRDEALAELTGRYFSSHGPATVRDYVWWSGLTVRDARTGIEMVRPALAHEAIGDRVYWFVPSRSRASRTASSAYLLPNYDEYLIAYKDRDAVAGAPGTRTLVATSIDAFAHFLVVNGQFAGIWRRTLTTGSVLVGVVPYRRLSREDTRSVAVAAERYGRFMNTAVTVSTS